MAQANTIPRPHWPRVILYFALAIVAASGAAAFFGWMPQLTERLSALVGGDNAGPSGGDPAAMNHAEEDKHDHDHGHDNPNALELSQQARRNIGLRTGPVELAPYDRKVSIPGIVVERPGQSVIDVTAPLTGVVTQVHATVGESVSPGAKLFDLRLTHEDVVQAQADFLRTAQELDVIRKDVRRLQEVTRDGAVAGKLYLERKYEEEKQAAALQAQREALMLHGLSADQVEQILKTRKLLPSISVFAPAATADDESPASVLQVQGLSVERGQHVNTGDSLAILSNHADLLIEGRAFEQDAAPIARALENGWSVSALIESSEGEPALVEGLQILYLASRVDRESRALHFYVNLPNQLLRDSQSGGRRYVAWRFKPGQRMQVQVPVERWTDRMVLPIAAIAQDGPETYVFRVNGDQLVRQPVYVEFRDQLSAVIASDGSVYPGDEIAMNAAHQLLVALKNKSGGGVDPHAGHSH
jgi:multidrug efflux pump subunit AcrA (membrane-fusion protein)